MSDNLSKYVSNQNFKFILQILIVGVLFFIINTFLYQICFVVGDSMKPSLNNGSIIFIKKYNLNIKYRDIIVAKKNGKTIIKRVVGTPGDKIVIDEYLYINDKKKDEYYILDKGEITYPIILKNNEYFVLGDNLEQSKDSRFYEIGIVNKSEIIGKKLFN